MSKVYTFEFSGSKESFLDQLNQFQNNNHKFYYFDDYIVELAGNEIRFGIARGGHSGGYWFVPTITESDNMTSFSGKIRYIGSYTEEKGIKRILNNIDEILLFILLLPAIILIKLYLFFSWLVRKLFKRPKSEEPPSEEDRLYHLMEDHLNCTRK